jgi:LysM repeat protein
MEWKTNPANDDMPEEHYTTLKDGASGIFGEKSKLPLIIILLGVVFLVVLFFIFNPRPPKTGQPDPDVIDARLALLEKQINEIDRIKEKIEAMDFRLNTDAVSSVDIDKLTGAIQANAAAVSQMDKKIGQLETELQQTAEKIKAQPAARAPQKSPPAATPEVSSKKPPVEARSGNGLIYHTVQKGDTLYRLSQKYGISVAKLQELNNMGQGTELFPGKQLIVGPAKQ